MLQIISNYMDFVYILYPARPKLHFPVVREANWVVMGYLNEGTSHQHHNYRNPSWQKDWMWLSSSTYHGRGIKTTVVLVKGKCFFHQTMWPSGLLMWTSGLHLLLKLHSENGNTREKLIMYSSSKATSCGMHYVLW